MELYEQLPTRKQLRHKQFQTLIPLLEKIVSIWKTDILSKDQELVFAEILDDFGRIFLNSDNISAERIRLLFEKTCHSLLKEKRPLKKKEHEALIQGLAFFKGDAVLADLAFHGLSEILIKKTSYSRIGQERPFSLSEIHCNQDAWDLFIDDFQDQLEQMVQSLLKLEAGGSGIRDEQNKILRTLHRVKGASRLLQIDQVCSLLHELENLSITEFKEKRNASKEYLQIFFKCLDLLEEISFITFDDLRSWFNENGKRFEENKKRIALFIQKGPKDRGEQETIPISKDFVFKSLTGRGLRIEPKILQEIVSMGKRCWVQNHELNRFKKEINIHLSKLETVKTNEVVHRFQQQMQHTLEMFTDALVTSFTEIDLLCYKVLNLRLSPLTDLFRILPRLVRNLSEILGKKIDLEVSGGGNFVKREHIWALETPLVHLIRNAIDHGIEKPSERIKRGKAEKGKLKIKADNKNGELVIKIIDDGKGIPERRIVDQLVRKNLMVQDEAEALSREELLKAIFMPGFSTKVEVSEISGRGIGMDLVLEEIEKVGGKIEVATEEEKGTEFIISLPSSLSSYEAMVFWFDNSKVAILKEPDVNFTLISSDETTFRSKINEIEYKGEKIPLIRFESWSKAETYLVEVNESKFAVQGNLLEENELFFVQKEAAFPFLKTKGYLGLNEEGGEMVIAISPFDLESNENKKKVLIIDDSATVRMQLKFYFEKLGYAVVEAKDGNEGWSKLNQHIFDLVTIDWQMPRISGKDLVKKIRRHKKMKNLFVVVISSEVPEKVGEKVECDAWVLKEENMLSKLEELVKNQVFFHSLNPEC